jgi:hypothetical protein
VDKRNIDVVIIGEWFNYNNFFIVKAENIIHDVPNVAWHIWKGANAFFYATDTNSLDGIEAKNYDLYLVEANYSENEILERIRAKQQAGQYCHEWDVLKNHLSKEKADDWLYQNMGPSSRYVYLHQHEDR